MPDLMPDLLPLPSPALPSDRGLRPETASADAHQCGVVGCAQERAAQLLAVSAALGGSVTTDQVADIIIQAALTIFQASVGLVALLSDDGSRLDCERIVGVPPAEADPWRSFSLDTRVLLADAVRERRLVVALSNEAHDTAYPDLRETRSRAAQGALLAVPLLVGERCLGGIGLICPPERCADSEQQTFLWTLAGQCALALERARLFDTERRAREEALAEVADRRLTEAALRKSEERLRLALDGGKLGTWHWDLATDTLDWPPATKALFGLPSEAATERERILGLLPPEDRERATAAMRAAIDGGPDYDMEYRVFRPDGSVRWIASQGRVQRDEQGIAVSMEGIVTDITERTERGRREQFLADLAERARMLTDPDEVIADAVRSLGEFLGLSRCVFADIDIEADVCTIVVDYCRDESVASLAGSFPISAFGETIVTNYKAGRVSVVDDVRRSPAQVPHGSVGAYDSVGVRAHVSVPVVHSARLVSVIGAHSSVPRRWKPEEVALIQAVVERTWLTVAVTRQHQALVHEAEATTRILESISDGFFTLDHDWRVVRVNAQAERLMTKARKQILGRNFWEVYPWLVGSIFEREYRRAVSEGVAVSFEEFYPPLDAWLEVRAYPSPDGLSVFYQNINARKRAEVERERLAERERKIANQLQAALQPVLPQHIPGLSLGRFTRPALDESELGGDFYDIFPLDKELFAVVIGDVSGKGLAAAQQLALVRNSLRTTLYLYRKSAEAACALNDILTTHDLLVGFVTVFVGIYDAATGQVLYTSCGHEPGLVRRANGESEELGTTGPPLGIAENVKYGECALTLSAGDTLLLYTDGLSEAGPSRRELLGTVGLTRLLKSLPERADVQSEAEALIARVSDFTAGIFRDDVALLMARRQW